MGLGLTWHDVVHMYECHHLAKVGYYLKSRFEIVRLISCLPKSNKGMKDDYLIASGEWSNDLHCPTQAGDPGAVPLGSIPWEGDLTPYFFFLCLKIQKRNFYLVFFFFFL